MHSFPKRLWIARGIAAIAVVAIAGVSAFFGVQFFHGSTHQVTKAHADAPMDPTGPWNLTVTFLDNSQPPSSSSLAFEVGGQMVNYTPLPGVGTWNITGPNTFNYQFDEQILDNNGNPTGTIIHVEQQATMSSDGTGYSAQGTGTVQDPGGNVLYVSHTTTQATRPVTNISPIVECVTNNGDGTYTALFGYLNRNTYPVAAPAGGNDNYFSGGSSGDMGQPSVFEPGRQYGVFKVNFGGGSLVWQLSKRTATASNASRSC